MPVVRKIIFDRVKVYCQKLDENQLKKKLIKQIRVIALFNSLEYNVLLIYKCCNKIIVYNEDIKKYGADTEELKKYSLNIITLKN